MICPECGKPMVQSTDSITTKIHGAKVTVNGIAHWKCPSCEEVLFDAEEGKKYDTAVIDEYSKSMGLLSPSEIKSIRKKSQLTQREFEKVLGVTSPTVSRWETGKVCQSKVADNLMRALDENEGAMSKAMQRAGVIKPSRKDIIEFPSKAKQAESSTAVPFVKANAKSSAFEAREG